MQKFWVKSLDKCEVFHRVHEGKCFECNFFYRECNLTHGVVFHPPCNLILCVIWLAIQHSYHNVHTIHPNFLLKGSPRVKNGKKADNVRFGRPYPPNPPKRAKSICCLKKRVNCNKCVFATKQRMFGVLIIAEILHYRGLPIQDPAYSATLLANMQMNMAFCGQVVSVQSPFPSDLRLW